MEGNKIPCTAFRRNKLTLHSCPEISGPEAKIGKWAVYKNPTSQHTNSITIVSTQRWVEVYILQNGVTAAVVSSRRGQVGVVMGHL
jgi:hypothetical protein